MVNKTTFITAHQAALTGLPKSISCDQALAGVFEGGHLGAHNGGAATAIARPANRVNLEGLAVVAVVVMDRRGSAVSARELAWPLQDASANSGSYGHMRLLSGASGLASGAHIVGPASGGQLDKAAFAANEVDEAPHLRPLLLGHDTRGHEALIAHDASGEIHNERIPVRRNLDFTCAGLRNSGRGNAQMVSQSCLPARYGLAPVLEGHGFIHDARLAFACSYVKRLLILFLVVSRHG